MGRAWRGASLVLIAAHDVFIYGDNGNGSCNGNGTRRRGQRGNDSGVGNGALVTIDQWHWGRSNRSNGKRNGATIDRSLPLQSIVWMWGAVGRGRVCFIRSFDPKS